MLLFDQWQLLQYQLLAQEVLLQVSSIHYLECSEQSQLSHNNLLYRGTKLFCHSSLYTTNIITQRHDTTQYKKHHTPLYKELTDVHRVLCSQSGGKRRSEGVMGRRLEHVCIHTVPYTIRPLPPPPVWWRSIGVIL